MLDKCFAIHQRIFPDAHHIRTFFSPGRVNLIGEHIDYNGGYVMPLALTIGNVGCISLRNDSQIHLYSDNFSEQGIVSVSLSLLEYHNQHGWANYAKGIIDLLIREKYQITTGFDITILGNLPVGAGLSSSASIEALIIEMMNVMFQLNISRTKMALMSQSVENNYIHVNCGIMDQFVILQGKKDHCLLLNTRTLEYKLAPIVLDEYDIVICNSMVKRGLVDSKYNERRRECSHALAIFQTKLKVDDLCSISLDEFELYQSEIHDITLQKRSRHAITENNRTKLTYISLLKNDIEAVGRYLYQSHISLRDDYEVSCKELDLLVELAMQYGSIGSRMTGAGFGGCTVNIVRKTQTNEFITQVKNAYQQATGLTPEIIVAQVADGTKEV